ncbi:MAG: hypothetical protein ACLU33_05985 [Christensenellales bacterium]
MENLEINNNISNNLEINNKQKNFLETTLGKTINSGLNLGLRCLLPDLIEDQVIEIKDTILTNGFKEGVKKAIDSAIDLGKSAIGIFNGNFENITQVQNAIKTGGILDNVSGLINTVVNKTVNNGKLPYSIGNLIKKGKNVIIDNISKNIENEFQSQLNSLEKINKYCNNWREYYNNKDFDGMEKEFNKIKDKMKEIVPIENTIKTARVIENLHSLIKNNGKNFELNEEELELAKVL